MGERYKFVEGHAHFITFAVVGWVDVFTRREYAEFLLQNLAYCRKNGDGVLQHVQVFDLRDTCVLEQQGSPIAPHTLELGTLSRSHYILQVKDPRGSIAYSFVKN